MSFFLFSFIISKKRRIEHIPPRDRVIGTSGSWEVVGKWGKRMNKVQKNVYTCM
jgi:hypothetical protein